MTNCCHQWRRPIWYGRRPHRDLDRRNSVHPAPAEPGRRWLPMIGLVRHPGCLFSQCPALRIHSCILDKQGADLCLNKEHLGPNWPGRCSPRFNGW
ncbi:hypothetical protein VTI28DRAFT_6606 [Corynascus sepedonium]